MISKNKKHTERLRSSCLSPIIIIAVAAAAVDDDDDVGGGGGSVGTDGASCCADFSLLFVELVGGGLHRDREPRFSTISVRAQEFCDIERS